ncbi:TetR family transcriptional regulator [Actinomadura sp. 3N407]|uniref:TetR family transcriptional regulator n=1 Tax=Actinomadura sp. 3N407 TaxID=3457423 RepID=UPI003FCC4A83
MHGVRDATGRDRRSETRHLEVSDVATAGVSGDAEDSVTRTRNALLDAVIQIAGAKGIEKVTYRSVAAEAGLSHSLVRFYFGSGDAMLTEALECAAYT